MPEQAALIVTDEAVEAAMRARGQALNALAGDERYPDPDALPPAALMRLTVEAAVPFIAAAVRAAVAEEIAREIERDVCEPGEQCADRFCPDCIRRSQCRRDAAAARRIGSAR